MLRGGSNSGKHLLLTIKTKTMSVLKVIELLGNSNKSWEDAAQKMIDERQSMLGLDVNTLELRMQERGGSA